MSQHLNRPEVRTSQAFEANGLSNPIAFEGPNRPVKSFQKRVQGDVSSKFSPAHWPENYPENNLNTSKKYRLFLLSNTNDLHISWIQKEWGIKKYREFKSCFEKFYLSHEICLRKPNANIYEFILNENHLRANETLFIDDTKDHTDAAKKLGIHVWNIDPLVEDVVNLWTRKEFQQ